MYIYIYIYTGLFQAKSPKKDWFPFEFGAPFKAHTKKNPNKKTTPKALCFQLCPPNSWASGAGVPGLRGLRQLRLYTALRFAESTRKLETPKWRVGNSK